MREHERNFTTTEHEMYILHLSLQINRNMDEVFVCSSWRLCVQFDCKQCMKFIAFLPSKSHATIQNGRWRRRQCSLFLCLNILFGYRIRINVNRLRLVFLEDGLPAFVSIVCVYLLCIFFHFKAMIRLFGIWNWRFQIEVGWNKIHEENFLCV